jgi:hypothetical protein
MCFRILLPTILLTTNLTSLEWFLQHPLPQVNFINSVDFVSIILF